MCARSRLFEKLIPSSLRLYDIYLRVKSRHATGARLSIYAMRNDDAKHWKGFVSVGPWRRAAQSLALSSPPCPLSTEPLHMSTRDIRMRESSVQERAGEHVPSDILDASGFTPTTAWPFLAIGVEGSVLGDREHSYAKRACQSLKLLCQYRESHKVTIVQSELLAWPHTLSVMVTFSVANRPGR